jgi:hypothetical protein
MKRLLVVSLALALSACATLPAPPAPVTIADGTRLHEQTALSVELAYQAAATAVLTANRAGLVPASARPGLAAADRRAFAAVQAVRGAYDAGNATGYAQAVEAARAAVASLLTAIRS